MSKLLSVTQLNQYIKGVFEDELLLHAITVFGEVSGYNVHNGTAYFILKDRESMISCVCFQPHPHLTLKNGDKVQAVGTPQYYAKGGKLSFIASQISPHGKGESLLRLIELRTRLKAEGLFNRKRPIPQTINTIGVITSDSGAVMHDIITIVTRRDGSVNLRIYNVKVQGEGTENQIQKAIRYFDTQPDVDALILARGGGSAEDLEAFNTEVVARAVASSQKFTISAVGHETDFTLCDLASDLRAATPSAAAELLTKDRKQYRVYLLDCCTRLQKNFIRFYTAKTQSLQQSAKLLLSINGQRIHNMHTRLEFEIRRLQEAMARKYRRQGELLTEHAVSMRKKIDALYTKKEAELKHWSGILDKSSPLKILQTGYAKVYQNKKPVSSVQEISTRLPLQVELKDGTITSDITKIESRTKT